MVFSVSLTLSPSTFCQHPDPMTDLELATTEANISSVLIKEHQTLPQTQLFVHRSQLHMRS